MRVKDAPRAPACSPAVDTYCGFLSLPTELRCHVYDYLLADPHAITISAGYTTIFGHRIRDKARTVDVPGLPLDYAPLVRSNHDAALLSVAAPPEIALEKENAWAGGRPQLQFPGPLALLRTCRMVNDELKDYMRGRKARKAARAKDTSATPSDDTEGLSLYVTYPHGVLVLNHLYPSLVKQARRVYISGYYTSAKESDLPLDASIDSSADLSLTPQSSFAAGPPVRSMYRASTNPTPRLRSSRTRLRLDPPIQRHTPCKSPGTFPALDKSTSSAALAALADTLRVLFPSTPPPSPSTFTPPHLASLQARILYPGPDSYSSVWSDESSPVSHLLRGICGGKIDMQVRRGSLGCGVSVGVTPQPEKRVVSTSWENWRVIDKPSAEPSGRRVMRRGREVRIEDLDRFLINV